MENHIRVLVAKPGLDGHDRGAKVIARALRDAGMEVIYTGLRQTPEMIVNAALQEDVQIIGLSILSGAHKAIVPRVLELLRENNMDDVQVLVGGIIPDEDAAELKKARGCGGLSARRITGRDNRLHSVVRKTDRVEEPHARPIVRRERGQVKGNGGLEPARDNQCKKN